MSVSEFFDMKMLNIVIIKKKIEYSLQWTENVLYLRMYNSHHLLVQFWLVASTTNELPVAFLTNAYFMVPDIAFLAT